MIEQRTKPPVQSVVDHLLEANKSLGFWYNMALEKRYTKPQQIRTHQEEGLSFVVTVDHTNAVSLTIYADESYDGKVVPVAWIRRNGWYPQDWFSTFKPPLPGFLFLPLHQRNGDAAVSLGNMPNDELEIWLPKRASYIEDLPLGIIRQGIRHSIVTAENPKKTEAIWRNHLRVNEPYYRANIRQFIEGSLAELAHSR